MPPDLATLLSLITSQDDIESSVKHSYPRANNHAIVQQTRETPHHMLQC